MLEYFERPFLEKRLHSNDKRIQMWSAYHLALFWEKEAPQFVQILLHSKVPEVSEIGIFLVEKHQIHQLAFAVFRLFTSTSDRTLKFVCANTLVHLQYQESVSHIQKWLTYEIEPLEVQTSEIQCIVENLLLLNPRKYWSFLIQKLIHSESFPIKTLNIFRELVKASSSNEQLQDLLHHYCRYRHLFHDVHFLYAFFPLFDNQKTLKHLENLKASQIPISQTYTQLLAMLQISQTTQQSKALQKLAQNQFDREALGQFTLSLEEDSQEFLFFQTLTEVEKQSQKPILRVQEQEHLFLLSLPVVMMLNLRKSEILGMSEEWGELIAKVYHSPFLSDSFMLKIANQLHQKLKGNQKEMPALSDPKYDTPHDAIWKVIVGYENFEHYPFSSVLPNPEKYSELAFLLPSLVQIHKAKFETLISQNQKEEVSYALKLFCRQPDEEVIQMLLSHFHTLIHHHFYTFFEFIEHVPDPQFVPKLEDYCCYGEHEVYQLILSICEIHQIQPPPSLNEHQNEHQFDSASYNVRLSCQECERTYHYSLQTVYFNPEVLEQRRLFAPHELWHREPLSCKNCGAEVPFDTPESFRANIYADLLTSKITSLEGLQHLKIFKPLEVPRLHGEKIPFAEFQEYAENRLAQDGLLPQERLETLLEIGKFCFSLSDFANARKYFLQSLTLERHLAVALFHLGMIAFQEKNLRDTRIYFSPLLEMETTTDQEKEWKTLAKHYMNILDTPDFRRASFKVIPSSRQF